MSSLQPLYAYALCRSLQQPVQLPAGIAGALAVIDNGTLSALVEPDTFYEAIAADDTQLMAAVVIHDRVLCQVFESIALLPLRFGTRFASQAALLAHLETYGDRYLQQLQALEGKAEYLLKLMPAAIDLPEITPGLKGRDYFLAKKQRLQTQTNAQQQQQEELAQLWVEINQLAAPVQSEPLREGAERIYLLLEPAQYSRLLPQINLWQQQYLWWEISLSQALPPYHFLT